MALFHFPIKWNCNIYCFIINFTLMICYRKCQSIEYKVSKIWIHLSILNHAHCSLKSSQYHWYGNIRIIDVWTFLVEPIEITIFILDTLYFTLRRVKWLCAKRWLVNRHFSLLLLVPSQYRKRRWKLCITREKVKCSI